MRSTLRKVIPSAFRYFWERWFVGGMLFDEPTETHTILNYVLVWGATPCVIPRSRRLV
nr:MAG TPA: hypothetical protein [Herelleviridae sp.]